MKTTIFKIIIAIILLAGCTADDTKTPISFLFHDFYTNASQEEQDIFNLVNEQRDVPLMFDEALFYIAVDRNNIMIDRGTISHDGIGAMNAEVILIGLSGSSENLSFGFTSAGSAVNAFINSSGHHDNLTNTKWIYTAVSFIVDTKGDTYIIQIFAY